MDLRPVPGDGEPLVFETTVEPPALLGVRYASWESALAGHREVARQLRAQQEN